MKHKVALAIAAVMLMAFSSLTIALVPLTSDDSEAAVSDDEVPVDDDIFNECAVTIWPAGEYRHSLCVKNDGSGKKDDVYLYRYGDSLRFYLQRGLYVDSYVFSFFTDADKYVHANRILTPESNSEGAKIKSVPGTLPHGRTGENSWFLCQMPDGSYRIRNTANDLYWNLEKGIQNESRLVLSKKPMNWNISIVSAPNNLDLRKEWDSFSFDYNDRTVTSLNWMSLLPDSMKITDMSIPGAHDAAMASCRQMNDMAQTQNYSIREQLTVGIRYFDLRLGTDGDTINDMKMVHGGSVTAQHNGEVLKFLTVMGWIEDFLTDHPDEMVILQIKRDADNKKTVEGMAYNYFRNWSFTYKGDHIPTLGEARGKALILSRLDSYINADFRTGNGNKQWAIDVKNWQESNKVDKDNYSLAPVTKWNDYIICTQDDYNHGADTKAKIILTSLFSNYCGVERYMQFYAHIGDSEMSRIGGYKNTTVFAISYTSSVDILGGHYPQDIARDNNYRVETWMDALYDLNQYRRTGVIVSDFTEGQLAKVVYAYNFNLLDKEKTSEAGSVFGGGALWLAITISGLFVILGVGYYLISRGKGGA